MSGGSIFRAMECGTLAPILLGGSGVFIHKRVLWVFSSGSSYGAGVRVRQEPDTELNCDYGVWFLWSTTCPHWHNGSHGGYAVFVFHWVQLNSFHMLFILRALVTREAYSFHRVLAGHRGRGVPYSGWIWEMALESLREVPGSQLVSPHGRLTRRYERKCGLFCVSFEVKYGCVGDKVDGGMVVPGTLKMGVGVFR